MTPVELTDRMLGLLDKGGWIKKDFIDRKGFCVVGAMEAILGASLRSDADFLVLPFFLTVDKIASLHEVLRQLVEEIDPDIDDAHAPALVLTIIDFNDDGCTSDEDIRLVLKRTREALRPEALPLW